LTDEQAMGVDYPTLDRVLWRLERGMDVEAIADELGLSPAQVRYVEMLTQRARYLLAAPRSPEDQPS
jgi:NH3-dependent NAD+ synthetase